MSDELNMYGAGLTTQRLPGLIPLEITFFAAGNFSFFIITKETCYVHEKHVEKGV